MSASRIHAYLRASYEGKGKQHERVGPFLAGFPPGNDHPMLNHAVPDDGAQPSRQDVDALVAAFRTRGLTPRLEYASDVAPAVEAALVAAGFAVDARLPLMGCRPEDATVVEVPAGFTVACADTDPDHEDAILAADEAYGEPLAPPGARVIAARRAMVAGGGAVVLAREDGTGLGVGSGLFPVPRAGVSELAAIGTCQRFRGRGVAAAVTSVLVRRARETGVGFLWLTPDHEQGERIYTRVGFARIGGSMVHISRPS